jgi:uncharacterized repeat protein (TIGR03803 family)
MNQRFATIMTCVVTIAASTTLSHAATLAVTHSFSRGISDGKVPYGALLNIDGTFYGTTFYGGKGSAGTVYATSPTGQESIVHDFLPLAGDGANPTSSLVALNGILYGSTQSGGSSNQGAIFAVTPAGAEHVVYSFKGGTDGREPQGALTVVHGVLYGTTLAGGLKSEGTVFAVTPSGQEKLIHSFGAANDGRYPAAALLAVANGFVGTTTQGGDFGDGSVFTLTSAGVEHVLYSFTYAIDGGIDGAFPYAPLIAVNGIYYGTTESGGMGGTVFSLTPGGVETVLHSFYALGDGSSPEAGLLYVKGVLYGTTDFGGAYQSGTVFSVTLTGDESVLSLTGRASASNRSASNPVAPLILYKGALYGTSYAGGDHNSGTVFAVSP